MEIYKVICSDENFINEDIADEQKKRWIPVSISSVVKGDRLVGCVLFKKTVIGEEETWAPEPEDIWKRKQHSP